jgi:hypothetical protein
MALTHRLQELGLLTEWGYRSSCVQLSRLGYRSSEPGSTARESSQLLAKVLRSVRGDGETPTSIALSIGISGDELQDHLFGLTLTAINGDGRDTSQTPAARALHLVPSAEGRDHEAE